jgi:hypothetical protein
MSFINLTEYAHLEQKVPFSTLKTMISRKDSFQTLTKFSAGHHVLNAEDYNIVSFVEMHVFLQLNRTI